MLRSLAVVEKDMDEVRKDMRLLDKLVYKANIENAFNNESAEAVKKAIGFKEGFYNKHGKGR
ncbi:hypothetical protein GCM10009865_04090 [Aeromicrobium ponti]|uniref:Uncharacterized protein n=1 Tax=Cytobacillus oceanisediminis TaxID=665099 RepID=A0A562K5Z7_9BACI|nr:hypothetical protein [Cytobacillus oceanisediminis]TWH90868.1 hypothetical protein IQ19_00318 [Cytobacillus oceanisediminis]